MVPIVLLAALALGEAGPRPAPADVPARGRYVEARTASVFAGACHYGAERTTQGREALLAWSFEGGRHAGTELAGVTVALALAGTENLADAGSQAGRRALVYVDEAAPPARAEAAVALLRARHPALFGAAGPARRVALTAEFAGSSYRVEAPGLFTLRGATLPDRACCKMPQDVWYAPLAPVERPLVGRNELFAFSDGRLGGTWSRADENTGFVGRFDDAARRAAPASAPASATGSATESTR